MDACRLRERRRRRATVAFCQPSSRREWLWTVVSACLAGHGAVRASAASTVVISIRPRTIRPGDVLLVRASGAPADAEVTGTVFGQPIPFARSADGWQALVGVDLDTTPGRRPLTVRAEADGLVATASETLAVLPRSFRTRRLTVAPGFVTPPPDTAARLERERDRMAAIFAAAHPVPLWEPPFERPVPGIALSSFGVRSVFNAQLRTPHAGTDFRAPTGTPVRAPAAGRVVLAEEHYFAGNQVVIDHGAGLFSSLAHLSAFDVAEGAMVERGTVVGRSGATGRVTGPHVHWAVRVGRARVDGLSLLALFEA